MMKFCGYLDAQMNKCALYNLNLSFLKFFLFYNRCYYFVNEIRDLLRMMKEVSIIHIGSLVIILMWWPQQIDKKLNSSWVKIFKKIHVVLNIIKYINNIIYKICKYII